MDAIFDSYREYIEKTPALADAPDWESEFLFQIQNEETNEMISLGQKKKPENTSNVIKIYFGFENNSDNTRFDVSRNVAIVWKNGDNDDTNKKILEQVEYNAKIHIGNFEEIINILDKYRNFYFKVDKRGYLDIPDLDRYKRRHITFNIINYLYHKEKRYRFSVNNQSHFIDYPGMHSDLSGTIEMCNKAYYLNGNNVFHVFEYLDDEWYEEQESLGCGRHALNNLLRGKFFIKSGVKSEKSLPYGHLDKLYFPVDLNIICREVNTRPHPGNSSLNFLDEENKGDGCPESENYELIILVHAMSFLANFATPTLPKIASMPGTQLQPLYKMIEDKKSMENYQGILIRYPSHYACFFRNSWYYDSISKEDKLGEKGRIPIKNLGTIKEMFAIFSPLGVRAYAFERKFEIIDQNPLKGLIDAYRSIATTAVTVLETTTK